ncbi:SDR family NAD(P)-dependent oxidoreductase [Luteipulveratus halotolerans]|nr:SDR family NAD(P)-dependent oxidoreductase [Luteipulveratus halotolerans]
MGRVLITGASSGIGAALARRLAAPGHELVLTARRQHELDAVAADVRRSGGSARVIAADLRDDDSVDGLVASLSAAPDAVVCNAGLSIARSAAEQVGRHHDLERSMRVTFLGHSRLVLGLLPAMAARGSGHVVGVPTVNARMPVPGWGAYCASKAAMDGWLRAIGPELRRDSIDVSVVELGLVRTPMSAPTYGDRPPFSESAADAAARIERVLRRPRPLVSPAWARAGSTLTAAAPALSARLIGLGSLRRRR